MDGGRGWGNPDGVSSDSGSVQGTPTWNARHTAHDRRGRRLCAGRTRGVSDATSMEG